MIARIVCAAAVGTVVTLLLLYAMQALIRNETSRVEFREAPRFELASIRIEPDPPPEVETLPLQDLKPPVVRPPARPGIQRLEPTRTTRPVTGRPSPPVIDRPAPTGAYDQPLVTVMSVATAYPSGAIRDGREGVIVQFDVLADGSVSNVAVIDASHPAFESSALIAMSRFRFKARVVDGVPEPTVGLQRRFVYQMERG